MGRIWFFCRSFVAGSLAGCALIVHFTHRQISAADWEAQHALEDMAALEAHVARRGSQQLRETAQAISRQTEMLHAAQSKAGTLK